MAKEKTSNRTKNSNDEAVLNLTIDGSYPDAEVREIVTEPVDAFQTPCSVNGLTAGISGGTVGYFFGFAGHWMKNRLKGSLRGASADGWTSAKTFGVMGGLYAAVNCFMLRLRQTQDAWNGAAAGCATGLALGWGTGPASALQSCVMLGAFSYFLDGMAGGEATAYAADHGSDTNSSSSTARSRGAMFMAPPLSSQNGRKKELSPVEMLLSPAIPLLHALNPCGGNRCAAVGQFIKNDEKKMNK